MAEQFEFSDSIVKEDKFMFEESLTSFSKRARTRKQKSDRKSNDVRIN